MALIRAKDTKGEILVRRMVFRLGYRYRIYDSSLAGKPDLVFKGRRKVIFVHGCFWHGHGGCRKARLPKSKASYWHSKISGNRKRDHETIKKLLSIGWKVLVIWECELLKPQVVQKQIVEFLGCSGKETLFKSVS